MGLFSSILSRIWAPANSQGSEPPQGTLAHLAWQARLKLRPVVSIEVVRRFETEAAISLPEDYVAYLTTIGDGGLPPCRLTPLHDWNAGYWSASDLARDLKTPCLITPELQKHGAEWIETLGVIDALKRWDNDDWDPLRGTLAVAEIGCGLFFHMIVNGPCFGRIFVWGDRAKAPPVFVEQQSFSSWLESHLSDKVAGTPVHFLDGRLR
jgi:hypothetical protein